MMIVEQRFKIGQKVRVIDDFRYGDWIGVDLWISGVSWCRTTRTMNYTVVDDERHFKGTRDTSETDGFYDDDLLAAD